MDPSDIEGVSGPFGSVGILLSFFVHSHVFPNSMIIRLRLLDRSWWGFRIELEIVLRPWSSYGLLVIIDSCSVRSSKSTQSQVDAEFVAKYTWDPEEEAREKIRRERREEEWSSAAPMLPTERGPELPRGKKKTEGRSITESSVTFGAITSGVGGSRQPSSAPMPRPPEAAPWLKAASDDLDSSASRARVEPDGSACETSARPTCPGRGMGRLIRLQQQPSHRCFG